MSVYVRGRSLEIVFGRIVAIHPAKDVSVRVSDSAPARRCQKRNPSASGQVVRGHRQELIQEYSKSDKEKPANKILKRIGSTQDERLLKPRGAK